MRGEPTRIVLRREPEDAPRPYLRPGKRGIVAVVVLFALCFVAARSCQQAQIRITKERAIATALPRAGFDPDRTQVRLVRQGLNGRPYWAVSFSDPAASGGGYARLTTVRVDANTGKVAAVNRQR